MGNALVLSGGGVSGVAWHAGLLLGAIEAEPALDGALRGTGSSTTFVGTSAGAAIASQFAAGLSVQELYDLQLPDDPAVGANLDLAALAGPAQKLIAEAMSAADLRDRIAGLVRSGFAADPVDRRSVLAARLPRAEWPDARLLITAVDADTEELAVFEKVSGVDLVDAVTASCAVPLVWPAVRIGARLFVDGGVRSSTNADLAVGCERVLVLAASGSGAGPTPRELAALEPSEVLTVFADSDSIAAFGGDSLDASTRRASAAAGRAQGGRVARQLLEFWSA